MSSDYWFKFYPRTWLSSPEIRLLSPAERGVLLDVLCLIYDSCAGGFVRSPLGRGMTTEEVARALGVRPAAIVAIANKSGAITIVEGCPHSSKAARELETRETTRERQREGGKAGAESRWQKTRRGAEIFRK